MLSSSNNLDSTNKDKTEIKSKTASSGGVATGRQSGSGIFLDQKMVFGSLRGRQNSLREGVSDTYTNENISSADEIGGGDLFPAPDHESIYEISSRLIEIALSKKPGGPETPEERELKENLYKLLDDITGLPITGERTGAIEKFLQDITKGEARDINGDGILDANDLIILWVAPEIEGSPYEPRTGGIPDVSIPTVGTSPVQPAGPDQEISQLIKEILTLCRNIPEIKSQLEAAREKVRTNPDKSQQMTAANYGHGPIHELEKLQNELKFTIAQIKEKKAKLYELLKKKYGDTSVGGDSESTKEREKALDRFFEVVANGKEEYADVDENTKIDEEDVFRVYQYGRKGGRKRESLFYEENFREIIRSLEISNSEIYDVNEDGEITEEDKLIIDQMWIQDWTVLGNDQIRPPVRGNR